MRAIVLAICAPEPLKVRGGGCVESVVTPRTHLRFRIRGFVEVVIDPVAIEKSIRSLIKAYPETNGFPAGRADDSFAERTCAAPHRNAEVLNAQVIGTWP